MNIEFGKSLNVPPWCVWNKDRAKKSLHLCLKEHKKTCICPSTANRSFKCPIWCNSMWIWQNQNIGKLSKVMFVTEKLSFYSADLVLRYTRPFCLLKAGGTFLHHYYDLPLLKDKHSSFRNILIFSLTLQELKFHTAIKLRPTFINYLFHNGFCLAKQLHIN